MNKPLETKKNTWLPEEKPTKLYDLNTGETYKFGDKQFDDVNCPKHYTDGKIEVIDYIEDKNLSFCLGNAIKYISRAGKKHSADKSDKEKMIQDLEKAIWYINRRIKEIKEDLCD